MIPHQTGQDPFGRPRTASPHAPITSCPTGSIGGSLWPTRTGSVSPTLDTHLADCGQCGYQHLFYHSCRHRACPQCGYDTTTRWLDGQRDLLLPVPYFHVVFTLPAELRRLVRSHQNALLPVLFRAAFEALAELGADPKRLGAQVGAFAVLHTWTRTLEWHPHVHLLVPGGGLAPDDRTWVPARRLRNGKPFLIPGKALAKLFRGRFLHLARRALPGIDFPHVPWGKRWVVFAKPTVQGVDAVLEYLGRYVHKTAITDGALVGMSDDAVSFRYRDSRDQRKKTMRLPAGEFLRRFLQHVLPKGLHRVRAFGLLHPARRSVLRRLQLLRRIVDDGRSNRLDEGHQRARACRVTSRDGFSEGDVVAAGIGGRGDQQGVAVAVERVVRFPEKTEDVSRTAKLFPAQWDPKLGIHVT